jgi:hypothetical protein
LRVNGDDLSCIFNFNNQQLAPNQSVDITASIVAPNIPGSYFTTYRLTYGDNIEFGDKLIISI